MQTQSEIRAILQSVGRRPRRRLGQNFLIDGNLMRKLLELADLDGSQTVLEVGPGTGSLTEELLARCQRVVAVELDDTLAETLSRRLGGAPGLTIIRGDAMSGRHSLSPSVLEALGECPRACVVANLPYGLAMPLVLTCLLSSWRASRRGAARGEGPPAVFFERLTVTLQAELADRLAAEPGSRAYGAPAVIARLLADANSGRAIPPSAFWPRPKVHSRMLRLDFSPARAGAIDDADALQAVLAAAFRHRRKTLAAAMKLRDFPFPARAFTEALSATGTDPSLRAEQVEPERYRALSNLLAGRAADRPAPG